MIRAWNKILKAFLPSEIQSVTSIVVLQFDVYKPYILSQSHFLIKDTCARKTHLT